MNTDEEKRSRNRRAKRGPVQSAIANRNSTMPCAGSPAHRVPSPEAVEIGPRPLTSLSALRHLQSSICNLKSVLGLALLLATSLSVSLSPSLSLQPFLRHTLRTIFRVTIRPSLPSTLGLFVRDTPEPTPLVSPAAVTRPSTELTPRQSRSYTHRHTRPAVLRPRPYPAPGESFPGWGIRSSGAST